MAGTCDKGSGILSSLVSELLDVPPWVPKEVLWFEAAAGTQVEATKVKRSPGLPLFLLIPSFLMYQLL